MSSECRNLMRAERFRIYIGLFNVLFSMAVSSCVDETFADNIAAGTYISFRGTVIPNGTHYGSSEDYTIETIRILAFDPSTGDCVTNMRYDVSNGDVIQHPIKLGKYDFVFLANEPITTNVAARLTGISNYSNLDDIAYPASTFASDHIIPMIQIMKEITILADGKAQLSDGTPTTVIQLSLDRLAVRVDVVLEAEDDLEDAFTGVILTKIPDAVPLTANYSGTIGHTVMRTLTKADDGSYFSNTTPSAGNSWAKKISRIIIPANELKTEAEEDIDNAVVFTVNMGTGKYSPHCELKIASSPDNYSLPINTKLDLHGVIKEPLQVNIEASEWRKIPADWEIAGTRILNVSDMEVDITDFNGARISFWSNMPVVRVLNTVQDENGNDIDTNTIFNGLSSQDYNPNVDARIWYNEPAGYGYMDVVLDSPDPYNYIGDRSYTLTLRACEDVLGTNSIERKIKVNVKQKGLRYAFDKNAPDENGSWSNPYVGAFWKDDETGERVISGIRWSYWWDWVATVPDKYKDFIVLSSTPSFDPNIGTDHPGDPEKYPVTPNRFKFEEGDRVEGKGRIYFRIGLKSKNTTGKPRYGVVNLSYVNKITVNGVEEVITETTQLYIRQGEDPDYVIRSGATGTDYGSMFSAYNLTVKNFKNNPNTSEQKYQINYSNLDNEVDFVDYPTQAGALFQWGLPRAYASEGNNAFHPTNKNFSAPDWELTSWPRRNMIADELWGTVGENIGSGTYYEICPDGYYRPADGPINQTAINSYSYASQINQSDWRMSIFQTPMTGDGYGSGTTSTNPFIPSQVTEIYNPVPLEGIIYGFYADGFFDRRPIQEREMLDGMQRASATGQTKKYKGVALDNTEAAFKGTLVFNPDTKASVFFPSAGRRWLEDGSLEYAGETGFYWSSSVAPGWTNIVNGQEKGSPYGNIWTMQLCYITPSPISMSNLFGSSIRCIKKK